MLDVLCIIFSATVMCFLSDCVKMTTCASFICSIRLRYALADF